MMETPAESSSEARTRRLEELDRIIAIQSERNSDLTEEAADALIQQYLRDEPRHG